MKFMLAPMATVSHEAFRIAVEKFGGCDEYFTEMINAGSLINRGPFEKYYLLNGPVPEKIVWQLTGSRTDYMEKAAAIVMENRGIGVDLNMGCSAPQIVQSGAGITWMLRPLQETAAMVRAIKNVLEHTAPAGSQAPRLSAKIRLGDENFTDEGFFSFCDMLVSEGVQLITVHPRTRRQKYRIPARWEYAEQLASRISVPVILNGDISDRPSYKKACAAVPHAAGIMIARAAAQKPWIFAELTQSRDITIDLLELGLAFIDDIEKYQPPEFHRTRLQRFFSYYCLNFSFWHYAQTELLNAKSTEDSRTRLRSYFEKCPEDRTLVITS
jgi:tRNA-dihydrouridine synthase B